MITPRQYLSYSQMALFERSPEQYDQQYIYGVKSRETQNMRYGKMLADGLEEEEATGDPLLDLMASQLPKFELMDKPIYADLKNGKEIIKLLAKPDTCKKDYTAFKEFKTSTRKWTQRMADESEQITFYTTVIWLTERITLYAQLVRCGDIPQDEP